MGRRSRNDKMNKSLGHHLSTASLRVIKSPSGDVSERVHEKLMAGGLTPSQRIREGVCVNPHTGDPAGTCLGEWAALLFCLWAHRDSPLSPGRGQSSTLLWNAMTLLSWCKKQRWPKMPNTGKVHQASAALQGWEPTNIGYPYNGVLFSHKKEWSPYTVMWWNF